MKSPNQKLNSKSGLSMLMALFLIVVVTFVSTIVLTSTITGLKAKRSDRESQQAYLTVSSAANIFKKHIMNSTYKKTVTQYYSDAGITPIGTPVENTEFNMDEEFKALMEDALDYTNEYGKDYEEDFTMKLSGMDDVKVHFKMDGNNYSIYAKFSIDEKNNHDYNMYLTIETKRNKPTSRGWNSDATRYSVVENTVVTWKNYYIGKSEDDENA